jgi:TetR/AcrR family transcriptional regulator, tetracycline repressor protein
VKRVHVVTGALALLDADGLDGLTMRKLGAQLGVQAGGIYWHFTNKQALLEAMADQIVGEVTATPLEPGTWDAQLAEIAYRMRRALLANRDGARCPPASCTAS